MDPISLIVGITLGAAALGIGVGLKSDSFSPTDIATRHHNKLYRFTVGDVFGATGFALRTKSGVYLATAGHVCDVFVSPRLTPDVVIRATVDDKSTSFLIDKTKVKLINSSDLCFAMKLPDETPAFDLSQGEQKLEDVWLAGYPAGMPLTAVYGHITGVQTVRMPSDRLEPQCTGTAYSWEIIEVQGPFNMVLTKMGCMFKADMIATSLTAAPGNSGSPIFNKKHEVVGVISSIDLQTPAGYAMTVPVTAIQEAE